MADQRAKGGNQLWREFDLACAARLTMQPEALTEKELAKCRLIVHRGSLTSMEAAWLTKLYERVMDTHLENNPL